MKRLQQSLPLLLALLGMPCVSDAASLVWGTGKWGDTWGLAAADSGSQSIQTIPATSVSPSGSAVPQSTAMFTLGLTKNGGTTFQSTATFGDKVDILGSITPQAAQLGQTADLFIVVLAGKTWYMRNTNGLFSLWSGRVIDLVPFRKDVVLKDNLEVSVYTGSLAVRGELQIFIGYATADGVLHYTPKPLKLVVN